MRNVKNENILFSNLIEIKKSTPKCAFFIAYAINDGQLYLHLQL